MAELEAQQIFSPKATIKLKYGQKTTISRR